jgi:hypothetical protein
MTKLQENFNKAVHAYIDEFQKRYEIEFDGWVGDIIGEIATWGEFFFNFSEIKYCIDNNISFNYLVNWYDLILKYQNCFINLKSYIKMRKDAEAKENFNIKEFEYQLKEKYLKIIL